MAYTVTVTNKDGVFLSEPMYAECTLPDAHRCGYYTVEIKKIEAAALAPWSYTVTGTPEIPCPCCGTTGSFKGTFPW